MKTCSRCRITKPLSEFNRQRSCTDGFKAACRACDRQRQAAYARAKCVPVKKKRERDGNGLRECMSCREMLTFERFAKAKRGSGGMAAFCKPCMVKKVTHDKERHAANTRRWRRDNPDKHLPTHRAQQHKRRLKQTAQDTGLVTGDVIAALLKVESCHYCLKPVPRDKRTIDHVVPLNRGGLHDPSNLVMACATCNSSKCDQSLERFRERLQSKGSSPLG